jgi:hypothetical protein
MRFQSISALVLALFLLSPSALGRQCEARIEGTSNNSGKKGIYRSMKVEISDVIQSCDSAVQPLIAEMKDYCHVEVPTTTVYPERVDVRVSSSSDRDPASNDFRVVRSQSCHSR